MTKEPIMIDDVDVAECECIIEDYQLANNLEGRYDHKKNVCELGERGAEYYNLFCKDNPNCYYKQLKRKEQLLKSAENHIKDLNLMVHNGEERVSEIELKLKRKEKECEEWKNKLAKRFADERKKEIVIDQLKAENEHLSEKEEEARHYLNEAYKYKQTLTEIKELAERINNEGIYGYVITDELDKIIQKCEGLKDAN